MGVRRALKKLGSAVIKAAPVVAVVISIVNPGIGMAIGNAILPSTMAGTTAAAAVGTATISAGLTAANPNATGSDIAKAALAAGAGSYVGTVVGQYTTQAAGAGTTAGRIAGSAAGGGASATTGAIVQGAEPSEALKAGLRGAATAGLIQSGVEGARTLSAQGPQQAGEARLRVPAQGQYQRGAPIAQAPSTGQFTGQVPTGGGEGFVAPPASLYSSRFAPTTSMRATESGGVQPAYQTGESLITPSGMQTGSTTFRDRPDFKPPALTRREEDLLRESLGEAFQYLFKDQQPARESPTQLGATRRLGAPLTQASPGSEALAQALRIGDVGAPVFGGEKETGRRSGWNVESLRYMGNTEA